MERFHLSLVWQTIFVIAGMCAITFAFIRLGLTNNHRNEVAASNIDVSCPEPSIATIDNEIYFTSCGGFF